jgi:hypothetical protein
MKVKDIEAARLNLAALCTQIIMEEREDPAISRELVRAEGACLALEIHMHGTPEEKEMLQLAITESQRARRNFAVA